MPESESHAVPGVKSRHRLLLFLALLSIILAAGGVVAVGNYPHLASHNLLLPVFLILTVAPISGVSAALLAIGELRNIHEGVVSRSTQGYTRISLILGSIGGLGNTVILLFYLFRMLTFAGTFPSKDAMISDLNNIFVNAYRYRLRPDSLGGGNGSYATYVIPMPLNSNENGNFAVRVLHPDTIEFIAISPDSTSTIRVKLGPDGRPQEPWIYSGTFE